MRLAAATLITLAAAVFPAVAQEKTPEAGQVTPSASAPGAPARSPQNAAPHQGNAAANSDQQRQGEQTLQSKSGQNAKEEPSTKPAAANQSPVLVDGKLNVPGAPADSQAVPAKFSERNARIDKQPILGFVRFTDEQRRAIAERVKAANVPAAKTDAKVTQELPSSVTLHELPGDLAWMPEMRDLKYVRTDGRILVVYAPSWFVVDEIKN